MTSPQAGDDTTWGVLGHMTLLPEELDSTDDLAGLVREVNERTGVAACWTISTGELNSWDMLVPRLEFAVDKSAGALVWFENPGTYLPVGGTGEEEVEYWMPGNMNTLWLPPHSVVPVDTVYAAVAEYQRTRERPTCVEWIVATEG
jgi:hypothetical protein